MTMCMTTKQVQSLLLSPAQAVEAYAVCNTPYFRITDPDNSHMSVGKPIYEAAPDEFSKHTQHQLRRAHQLMRKFLGAELFYVQPDNQLPDQVYTADIGMFHIKPDGEQVAVVANLRYRGGEEKYFKKLAHSLVATVVEMPDGVHWEGSGDTVAIRDPRTQEIKCYLMGCGPRSDPRAAEVLSAAWGVTVHPIPLNVADSKEHQAGFHIDTAVMQTGSESGHLVIHRPVVSAQGLNTIKSIVPEKLWIDLSDADAKAMGTNGVVMGKKILLHDWKNGVPDEVMQSIATRAGVPLAGFGLSTEYKQTLADIGCDTRYVDLTTIILGGGSGKCGSNRISNAVSPAALQKWMAYRQLMRA